MFEPNINVCETKSNTFVLSYGANIKVVKIDNGIANKYAVDEKNKN
jgi:hypothetical protein